MKISRSFGVKSQDIEQARRWVEEVTGLTAQPRESSDLGGGYYLFGQRLVGEYLILVNNRDCYDNDPVVEGVDEWPIAICLDGATENSPLLAKLQHAHHYFVKGK